MVGRKEPIRAGCKGPDTVASALIADELILHGWRHNHSGVEGKIGQVSNGYVRVSKLSIGLKKGKFLASLLDSQYLLIGTI